MYVELCNFKLAVAQGGFCNGRIFCDLFTFPLTNSLFKVRTLFWVCTGGGSC